jgi:transcriptional regulator with XRE-family HTH domain
MTRPTDAPPSRRTRVVPLRTGSVAERLAYLFEVVHAPGARGYTAAEVARGVKAAGAGISDVYINKLLNGQRGEPSLRYLRMLAEFFGVPLTFFLDDEPGPIDGPRLDLQIRLRRPEVQAMLAAALRLPEPAQAALADIVNSLLRAEGHHPAAAPSDPDDTVPALIACAARLSPESLTAVGAIIDKLGVAAAAGDPPR